MTSGWPLHVVSDGSYLRKRGGRVVIEHPLRSEVVVPLGLVSELVLMGDVGWTPAVCRSLLERSVPIVICDRLGRVVGRFDPLARGTVFDHSRQRAVYADRDRRLALAADLVARKIAAQRKAMQLIERRRGLAPASVRLVGIGQAATSCTSLNQLRGLEGAASAAYFGLLRSTLDERLGFDRRDRRSRDVVNMGLNYVSALLREKLRLAIVTAGLDPTIGVLHDSYRGRDALVFDLMEPWRPRLLDATVVGLVGLGQLTPESTVEDDETTYLSSEARRNLVRRFSWKLDTLRPISSRPTESSTAIFHREARAHRSRIRSATGVAS